MNTALCPWTFRKEASREEASPCPAPCPEGEQTPSPFLTQGYAVWPSPRLLFAFSSSDFFFPAHVKAPHSNLQLLLSCLCVKQPPQAALLETGRWCCWADSEQISVFLALHCMRPPKVCVGVTRASVSQQRSNPGCQGAVIRQFCTGPHTYHTQWREINACQKHPVTAAPDKYVQIRFMFL